MSYKNTLIYPFSAASFPLLNYLRDHPEKWGKLTVAAPIGFGLGGEDASRADNRASVGIEVTEDFDAALQSCDCLIVTGGESTDKLHIDFRERITQAANLHIETICLCALNDDDLSFAENLYKENHTSVSFCANVPDDTPLNRGTIKPFSVPVIAIGEMIPNTNGFEILLTLFCKLKEKGIAVTSFAPEREGSFYGIHTLPQWFSKQGSDSDSDKVLMLNEWMNRVVSDESPELILLKLPGGLLKYNNILTNGFGIESFLVTQAITPDFLICCTLFQQYSKEYAQKLNTLLECRFGAPIALFHMANVVENLNYSKTFRKFALAHIGAEKISAFVSAHSEDAEIPLRNLLDSSAQEEIVKNLTDMLDMYQKTHSLVRK